MKKRCEVVLGGDKIRCLLEDGHAGCHLMPNDLLKREHPRLGQYLVEIDHPLVTWPGDFVDVVRDEEISNG